MARLDAASLRRFDAAKQPVETRYYFANARMFARIAMEQQTRLKDTVIAILFRDSDGTASAGRGLWEDKRRSLANGFEAEGFQCGVPMIPKPKSEAWMICAVKATPYLACAELERRSGNDKSPKSLKKELANLLKESPTRVLLNRLVTDRRIDVLQIDMPSLNAFRKRLGEVLDDIERQASGGN